jgi:hypothetical protein
MMEKFAGEIARDQNKDRAVMQIKEIASAV